MISSVEKYLDTLLSFVPRNKGNRLSGDYISLVHVPAHGAERVYSLTFDDPESLFTVASYKTTLWETAQGGSSAQSRPELDALQTTVPSDHPVFGFLDVRTLEACENASDGSPEGMDYYLMLWQKDGRASVVECYEPYSRESQSWLTVIGGLQALSSQFEYATLES